MAETIVGYKLLQDNLRGLNGEVQYVAGQWVTVPGNGCYVSIFGENLYAAGDGPVFARVECRERVLVPDAPDGVQCFRYVMVMPVTDPAILAQLAKDENPNVRCAAAGQITDPAILAQLAQDKYPNVRWAAATRITDPAILAQLAKDENPNVRCAAAGRITDPAILAQLAQDENPSVRWAAAARITDQAILAPLS